MNVVFARVCSVHGIRPSSPHCFCGECGTIYEQAPLLGKCKCGSADLKSMCDKCHVYFSVHGGRVPVELKKPS